MPSRFFPLASPGVSKLLFLCSIRGRFFVPTWFPCGGARSRGQDWPKATAAGARAAVLTAVSTTPHGNQVGARLIVSPAAAVLLAPHHRPTDPRHLVGEGAGGDLALLGLEQSDQPGILLG